jgi:hypothetical protein
LKTATVRVCPTRTTPRPVSLSVLPIFPTWSCVRFGRTHFSVHVGELPLEGRRVMAATVRVCRRLPSPHAGQQLACGDRVSGRRQTDARPASISVLPNFPWPIFSKSREMTLRTDWWRAALCFFSLSPRNFFLFPLRPSERKPEPGLGRNPRWVLPWARLIFLFSKNDKVRRDDDACGVCMCVCVC